MLSEKIRDDSCSVFLYPIVLKKSEPIAQRKSIRIARNPNQTCRLTRIPTIAMQHVQK